MSVYTRTGDIGTSSLYDGNRISKSSILFNTLGELDELASRIGMLCAIIPNFESFEDHPRKELLKFLRDVQSTIQDINSIIATTDTEGRTLPEIIPQDVKKIEEWIDFMDTYNPKLTRFILPGVRREDSQAQLCRTQTRRVERYLWKLNDDYGVIKVYDRESSNKTIDLGTIKLSENITTYMNRLSDFFFVLSRYLCTVQKIEDCFYNK